MPLVGTVLWKENRPSDHGNHLHVEPPTRFVGIPPLVNPGMTEGVHRIYQALYVEFGPGAYFTQATSATKWTHMGGWNRRTIAGSQVWSQHAWWNALDIGPYYGTDQEPFYEFLTTYDDDPGDDEMAIKAGDSGRTVRAIKKCYNAWVLQVNQGRLVDEANEDYGTTMSNLIREFQSWSHLPVTGQVDGLTFAALIRWEQSAQVGPPGPKGEQGPPGPQGPAGTASLPDRETVEIIR